MLRKTNKTMKIIYKDESEMLKALAHPVRLQIIQIIIGLREDECCVTAIQKRLDMPQSTISQHLQILRNRGIIEGNKKGVEVCYRVIDRRVREIMKIIEKE
jgi:ArsR family transcriptional regulator